MHSIYVCSRAFKRFIQSGSDYDQQELKEMREQIFSEPNEEQHENGRKNTQASANLKTSMNP